MRRRKANVPREKRIQILREYLAGNESAKELSERYDINPQTIYVWLNRYGKPGKSVPLPQEPKEETTAMASKESTPSEENELLKKRIKELESLLRQSELQNLALNTMIDIAEENGVPIRKKSGARQ